MAYSRTLSKRTLTLVISGKSDKNFSDILTTATNAQIYAAGKALSLFCADSIEGVSKTEKYLIETTA